MKILEDNIKNNDQGLIAKFKDEKGPTGFGFDEIIFIIKQNENEMARIEICSD